MRTCVRWNEDWRFIREDVGPEAARSQPGEPVTLPHTWNAVDGQDGGSDCCRGACWYMKRFPRPAVPQGGSVWLEFRGAASVDNGPNRRVYPQKADFTFCGGIYRDVYLLTVPAATSPWTITAGLLFK